jgi:hypothetical protein
MIRAFFSSLLYLHGGDFEKRGVETRLSRCVLCRSMLVMIVLCIDGAICLRVLRDKGHGGGNRGMHIGGTCAHAA